MKNISLIVTLIIALSINALATKWITAKHVCPICKLENTFYDVMSCGGYIYDWPSKYQYVYWPLTDSPSVYCCPECYFTSYIWDFESIPENKINTIQAYLKTVTLDKKYVDYRDIPMSKRLNIAENVYKILGRDNEFWCQFYRVIGYHYDEEKNIYMAKECRLKALTIARLMHDDKMNKGKEKEILIIIAAMYNFTGQKDSSLFFLNKASKLRYKNINMEKEAVKGFDKYLTELIKQYKIFLRKDNEE